MTQKPPQNGSKHAPAHVADLLSNAVLRTLILRARAQGMTRSSFVEAVGQVWDHTPESLEENVRDFVSRWMADDPPSHGKSDGR